MPTPRNTRSRGKSATPNPAEVYLAKLSSETKRSARNGLEQTARLFGSDLKRFRWESMTYSQALALRQHLAEAGYAVPTTNKRLSLVRAVMRECVRLGLKSYEDYQKVCEIGTLRGGSRPTLDLDPKQVRRLIDRSCRDRSPKGIRNTAMIVLFFIAGIKSSELVELEISDYRGNRLVVPGPRQRTIYVGKARKALKAWTRLRGYRPGPLFVPVLFGRVQYKRLNITSVRGVIQRFGSEAGIHGLTPHVLRAARARQLLGSGVDIFRVQRFLGNKRVSTTARYDVSLLKELEKATRGIA